MTPSSKGAGSIKGGISTIHGLLRVGPNGKPKLRVAAHLVNTIKEFHNYSRKRDSQGVFIDIPEDKNNHSIDTIRYMLNRMVADEVNARRSENKQKQERQYSKTTGRPLN